MKDFGIYSDEELVTLTLQGIRDAYGEIVSRYMNMVFRVALNIIPDYHSSEDIAQETFIDGFMQLSRLKNEKQLSPWLYGIARRKALNYITRRKIHADVDDYEEYLFTDGTSPEDEYIRKETACAIRKSIMKLSDKNKIVAEMFYLMNISITEIACRLSVPEGTIKSRLYDVRKKLKGELAYMVEKNQALPLDFDKAVKEKIKALEKYYYFNKDSYETFDNIYSETEAMIDKMPASQAKQAALAELYMLSYYKNDTNAELGIKAYQVAEESNNAHVLCMLYVTKIVKGNNYDSWINSIDNEAIPKMEKLNYPSGKGILLFWRGAANIYLMNIDAAYDDFTKAAQLIDKNEIYHACAVSGIKTIDYMVMHTDEPHDCCIITAERYVLHGTKLTLLNQPGFSTCNQIMYDRHKMSALGYLISRFDNMFFDTSLEVGKKHRYNNGSSTFKLVSYGEKVTVTAGTFNNCMHVLFSDLPEYDADIWYATGIGIVKVAFSGARANEEYELCEYTIKGGDGYYPFSEGNRWRYIKHDLPDYFYQCFEYEIDWTDGKEANLSYINLVGYKKNYLTDCKLDSEIYISQCVKLCDEWKLDEAIEALKKAVRENSTQNAVETSLAGIDYLTRFADYMKKGYRFCPSSMTSSYLIIKDGNVLYDESGAYCFGPYRWGSRFEENRIFGVKTFRYLQNLLGRIYDEKWVPGYSETRMVEGWDTLARMTVENDGSVTTKAGTFDNCIRITISAEKEKSTKGYYFDEGHNYVWCGTKVFWMAKGIGVVKYDFIWGDVLSSSSELTAYSLPAAGDEYLPVCIGNHWEYDEVNLTSEGYSAKRILNIACGINGKYLMTDAQEFVYLGTEEEYEAFKVDLGKKGEKENNI